MMRKVISIVILFSMLYGCSKQEDVINEGLMSLMAEKNMDVKLLKELPNHYLVLFESKKNSNEFGLVEYEIDRYTKEAIHYKIYGKTLTDDEKLAVLPLEGKFDDYVGIVILDHEIAKKTDTIVFEHEHERKKLIHEEKIQRKTETDQSGYSVSFIFHYQYFKEDILSATSLQKVMLLDKDQKILYESIITD